MLLTKSVTINWHPTTIERYKKLGYLYTKTGQPLEVKIGDLAKSSHVKVNIKCDYCNQAFVNSFDKYNRAKEISL